ncbi:MAG: VOC family protein [Solirubrobacteraceae bacterium]
MSSEAASIAPAARIGSIHLDVADLGRSRSFYEESVGLRAQRQVDGELALGVGDTELLVLRELPGARPARGWCGLYHFALLLPQRSDLGAWLRHAAERRVPLVGASDHYVSEALYLRDPDEHGIEIYWDRPRTLWEGHVAERMTTAPLDLEGLLAACDHDHDRDRDQDHDHDRDHDQDHDHDRDHESGFDGLPAGTRVGHVHLRVAEIASAVSFYRDVLGMELMASFDSAAAFFAAGGYHHHVGANTWESAGASQAPAGTATLTRATILLGSTEELERARERASAAFVEAVELAAGVLIHDPSGNPLLLASG